MEVENQLFNIEDYGECEREEDIKCNICFDTINTNLICPIKLHCNHSFHVNCIKQNLENNQDVCPMCRSELSYGDKLIIESDNQWMINPFTKRKIKVNGKTYKYLMENGAFK